MAAYLATLPMAQHPRKKPPKRRSAFRRIVVPILAWGMALAVVAALGVGLAVAFRMSTSLMVTSAAAAASASPRLSRAS